MRVLQIAPRVCWPLDTGAKLRNYHLARVLSERAVISLLAFSDEAGTPAELSFYDDVIVVPRRRGYTPMKILRGALGSTPLPVLNYTSETMNRTIDRLLDSKDFDLVQIESIHLMAYLPILRKARSRPRIVCDWHNIESELMSRYAERESRYLRRGYARFTAHMMTDFEKRALRDFDAHIAVSERDADQLRRINPDAKIFVIENGVDPSHYSSPVENATRNRIVFVGSMDYHANIDGVVEFAREVWPSVKKRKPELNFTIVGRDPAPEVRELSKIAGVEVTGTVDDVRPFYDQACAAIVPLKVGGGSRLKILEAMAAGVPVVSTGLGAEGLAVHDDENILIADTKEEMQELLISLVDDRELQDRIVAGGRALVTDRYDWARLGASLFEIYQGLLNS
jgi:sugar transferase (PEP-CTERM/EpsH1 system associated)